MIFLLSAVFFMDTDQRHIQRDATGTNAPARLSESPNGLAARLLGATVANFLDIYQGGPVRTTF